MARLRSSYFLPFGLGRAGLVLLLLLVLAGCAGMGSGSQTPVVTIEREAERVAAGSPVHFLVRAAPAPRAALTIGVKITSSGCELTRAPRSVTIVAGESQATLMVTTGTQVGDAGCVVTAAIAGGAGYRKSDGDAASASATVTPEQTREPREPREPMLPVVTIMETAKSVAEGSPVSFTLTATPPPASDLPVTVRWSEIGSFLPSSPPETVTIPRTGTVELTETIPDDSADEVDGSVTVAVEPGSDYRVGSPGSATVAVADNDQAPTGATPSPPPPTTGEPQGPQGPQGATGPTVSVGIAADASSVTEGETASFTVTADPAPLSDLVVNFSVGAAYTVEEPMLVLDVGWLDSISLTVTISASSSTATYSIGTPDDGKPQRTAYVTVTVAPGTGYVVDTRRQSAQVSLVHKA